MERRELLFFLTWRDIKVRYKQTALGVGWAVLQPLLTMVVFTIFFNRVAKISSGDIPYPVFSLAGIVIWGYFAASVTTASASLVANVPLLVTMVLMVVVGKLFLWTLVVWLFRRPLWTALLVGVGLTQIGEFSFILVQVARGAGHVGADIYNATLAAALVTILINAALVRAAPAVIARLRGVAPAEPGTASEPGESGLCASTP